MLKLNAKPRAKAPGPNILQSFLALIEMRKSSFLSFTKLFNRYGDIVRLSIPGFSLHLVFHPDAIKHFLKTNAENYRKSDTFRELEPLLGQGLLTSDGQKWREQRKAVASEFHLRKSQNFNCDTLHFTEALLKDWLHSSQSNKPRNIAVDMMKLTFSISGKSFFGADMADDADWMCGALAELMTYANKRMMLLFPTPRCIPTPQNRRAKRIIADIKQTADRIISQRINSQNDNAANGNDFIGKLISLGMNGAELRDMVITLLVTGHETTSNALSWTWYLLAKHKKVAARLQEELDHVLSGRAPSLEDFPKLEYTRKIFLEAMRLYPPGAVLTRNAIHADKIGDYDISAGSMVVCCAWVTHRHPEFWPEAEIFNPERFNLENIKSRKAFSYFPFGGGPRECVGQNFAILQGVFIIAMLAQHFTIDLVEPEKITPELRVILRPKEGIHTVIKKR